MEKRCPHCKRKFTPHPAVKKQRYCGSADCQRARKRIWQRQKLKSDPDYRENKAAAQRAWRERNRDYWGRYRKRHPAYQEKNRLRQKERNRKRRMIAKMDEQPANTAVAPGRYRLVPLYGKIAKIDELIVEIGIVARGYACDG
jgi:DNA repair exonuclease SbcCD ATPase subunit